MKKLLSRLLILLIIPCLIADPRTAAGFSAQVWTAPSLCFTSQALAPSGCALYLSHPAVKATGVFALTFLIASILDHALRTGTTIRSASGLIPFFRRRVEMPADNFNGDANQVNVARNPGLRGGRVFMKGMASVLPSDSNLSKKIASELLEIYRWLRKTALKHYELSGLFGALQKALIVNELNTPELLEQGLKRLEMRGLPIRLEGDRWLIGGIARKTFFPMTIQHWPVARREAWQALEGRTDGVAVAERICLLMELYGWTSEDLDIGRGNLRHWAEGKHPPSEDLLEKISRRLGIEVAWLSHGISRAELEQVAYSRLRPRHYGDNVSEMRIVAGLSVVRLAELSGVPVWTLRNFLNGDVRNFLDASHWPRLARVLGQSTYRLLMAAEKAEALRSLPTFDQQLGLLMLANGIAQSDLATVLQVSSSSISWYLGGHMPRPKICEKICTFFRIDSMDLHLEALSMRNLQKSA